MKKFLVGSAAFFAPVLAFAQTTGLRPISSALDQGSGAGIPAFITQLNSLINYVVPFLVGLAVLVIIYGVFSYIGSADDEEKRKTAKEFIIWGIIGVFIMLSIWGLINILVGTFNLNNAAPTSVNGAAVPVTAVTTP